MRVVMFIDILNAEIIWSEVEYVALVVCFHIVLVAEGAKDRFAATEEPLEEGGFVFKLLRKLLLLRGLILSHW